jgi:hypothetical protein
MLIAIHPCMCQYYATLALECRHDVIAKREIIVRVGRSLVRARGTSSRDEWDTGHRPDDNVEARRPCPGDEEGSMTKMSRVAVIVAFLTAFYSDVEGFGSEPGRDSTVEKAFATLLGQVSDDRPCAGTAVDDDVDVGNAIIRRTDGIGS